MVCSWQFCRQDHFFHFLKIKLIPNSPNQVISLTLSASHFKGIHKVKLFGHALSIVDHRISYDTDSFNRHFLYSQIISSTDLTLFLIFLTIWYLQSFKTCLMKPRFYFLSLEVFYNLINSLVFLNYLFQVKEMNKRKKISCRKFLKKNQS